VFQEKRTICNSCAPISRLVVQQPDVGLQRIQTTCYYIPKVYLTVLHHNCSTKNFFDLSLCESVTFTYICSYVYNSVGDHGRWRGPIQVMDVFKCRKHSCMIFMIAQRILEFWDCILGYFADNSTGSYLQLQEEYDYAIRASNCQSIPTFLLQTNAVIIPPSYDIYNIMNTLISPVITITKPCRTKYLCSKLQGLGKKTYLIFRDLYMHQISNAII